MTSLNNPSKIFIKSTNSYDKMIKKYNISSLFFIVITILINILIGNKELSLSLIKTTIVSLLITSVISYIINIIKKEYNILKIYTEDTTITISIVLALFSVNTNIIILVLSILLTQIVKNIFNNINISSSLYGILLITLYKYFNNESLILIKSITNNITYQEVLKLGGGIKNYLFSINYLNPVLSIIIFIYLYHYKSIKYNIVYSYIITFIIIIMSYSIFNGYSIYYGLVYILTSGVLFLTTYTISDYRITPTIDEGKIIYGIILGIISSILTMIIPELSIIITFILGPLLLTKIIDKISFKLKYNDKLYYGIILFLIAIIILVIFSLVIIY